MEVIDGPRLAAWVEEHANAEELAFIRAERKGYDAALARRIRDWANGAQANIETADKALIRLGLHLSCLPEDFFIELRRPRQADKRQRALDLYREGIGPAEIGERFGLSRHTVAKWARAAGLRQRGPHPQREYALDLYRQGRTTGEIAREIGTSPQVIWQWARAAGLPRRALGNPNYRKALT